MEIKFVFEYDYPAGLKMDQFERIDTISSYNNNYYKGVKDGHILFAKSDDDNTTEWFLIKGGFKNSPLYIQIYTGLPERAIFP